MIKVSVIMPSLNVAKYIREAMESVIHQSLKEIEILCVDAGSTDGTWEILKEYEAKDCRVKLISSEKKSYGYQMNLGIRHAQGKYIGIVETDDYIDEDMYKSLYEAAEKHQADVVKSDFDMFTLDADGDKQFVNYSLKRNNRIEYHRVYSCADYIDGVSIVECYIWNALYKKEYLEKYQIRFNETAGAVYQDFGFKYQVGFTAERIVALDGSYYRYRRDNQASSTYHSKGVEYNFTEAKYLLRMLKEKGITDNRIYKAAIKDIVLYVFGSYKDLLKWGVPSENTKNVLLECTSLAREYMKENIIKLEDFDYPFQVDIKLLMEDFDLFNKYNKVVAQMETEAVCQFVKKVNEYNEVVLFGSGIRGKAACSFLLNNRCKHLVAFCDNDESVQGQSKMNLPIVSPQKAKELYPNALYVICNLNAERMMKRQLEEMGVNALNICVYRYSIGEAFCTSCMVKSAIE